MPSLPDNNLFTDDEPISPTLLPAVDPSAPLAARMRPRTLDEFAGQEIIVGSGTLLRRAIENDQLSRP